MRKEISQKELKELLEYNPETGVFIHKNKIRGQKNIQGKIAGNKSSGYCVICLKGKNYLAHRLAWLYVYGKWPNNCIDHIDHETLNNKIINLRDVTIAENSQNQISSRKNNKYLGVFFDKRDEIYTAKIRVDRKLLTLGRFKIAEDARDAYVEAKRKYHKTCTL